MMMDPIFVLVSTLSQYLQIGEGLFGNEGSIEFALDVATGAFSFLLFAITLYAWTRRSRQPTLLIVSIGFLTFFIKQVIVLLPISALHGELFGSAMDFVTLALFFVALVVRPQRKEKVRSEVNDVNAG
jgi:hypothetical protein